jgi:hypothetical protein
MSTFVRRAIESDPRFVVTSRVVTSRNVSTDVGQPPGRLDDLAELALFDAVIVGAPESLGDRDVAGLEAFLRRRGGSVVMLLDRRAPGPYETLLGTTSWANDSTGKAESIVPLGAATRCVRPSSRGRRRCPPARKSSPSRAALVRAHSCGHRKSAPVD